mmetsp:Transcript_1388/g.3401  ORF Transcript_1388/g.3401 Transcript_1388/m.3401 type:complete len:327 (-) Transcript_1388:488-1468(-)
MSSHKCQARLRGGEGRALHGEGAETRVSAARDDGGGVRGPVHGQDLGGVLRQRVERHRGAHVPELERAVVGGAHEQVLVGGAPAHGSHPGLVRLEPQLGHRVAGGARVPDAHHVVGVRGGQHAARLVVVQPGDHLVAHQLHDAALARHVPGAQRVVPRAGEQRGWRGPRLPAHGAHAVAVAAQQRGRRLLLDQRGTLLRPGLARATRLGRPRLALLRAAARERHLPQAHGVVPAAGAHQRKLAELHGVHALHAPDVALARRNAGVFELLKPIVPAGRVHGLEDVREPVLADGRHVLCALLGLELPHALDRSAMGLDAVDELHLHAS